MTCVAETFDDSACVFNKMVSMRVCRSFFAAMQSFCAATGDDLEDIATGDAKTTRALDRIAMGIRAAADIVYCRERMSVSRRNVRSRSGL